MSKEDIAKVVDQGNAALHDIGIDNIQIKAFEGDPSSFKQENLDKTDAIALFGGSKEIVDFIGKTDPNLAALTKAAFDDGTHESTRTGGYIIPVETVLMKRAFNNFDEGRSDMITRSVFTVLHSAWHLSKPGQKEYKGHTPSMDKVLTWSGTFMQQHDPVAGEKWGPLKGYLNNLPLTDKADGHKINRNEGYRKDLSERFNAAHAKDNYDLNRFINDRLKEGRDILDFSKYR